MIIDTIFSIILLKIIQLYHIILLICSILITWIKKLSIRQLIEQIVIIFLKVYGIIISRITQIKSKLHITSPPFVITKIRENTYESNKLVETKCITSRIFNTKLKKYYNSSFRYYTIDKITPEYVVPIVSDSGKEFSSDDMSQLQLEILPWETFIFHIRKVNKKKTYNIINNHEEYARHIH